MNSRQQFTILAGVGVGLVILALGAMYAPAKPPTPPKIVQVGDVREVRDVKMYARVFESCIKATPREPQQCRWSAEEAAKSPQYWDGAKWVNFNSNVKGE